MVNLRKLAIVDLVLALLCAQQPMIALSLRAPGGPLGVALQAATSGRKVVSGRKASSAPSAAGGTGSIQIQIEGEYQGTEAQKITSAPYIETWIDGGVKSHDNPRTVAGLAAGSAHTASFDYHNGFVSRGGDRLTGYVLKGTCSYPEGGAACYPTTFPEFADAQCALPANPTTAYGSCADAAVAVSAGQVTKVVYRHVSDYEGFGQLATGGRAGANFVEVSSLANLLQAMEDACNNDNTYIAVTAPGGELSIGPDTTRCGTNVTVDFYPARGLITLTNGNLALSCTNATQARELQNYVIRGFGADQNGLTRTSSFGILNGASGFDCFTPVKNVVAATFTLQENNDDHLTVAREVAWNTANEGVTIVGSLVHSPASINGGNVQNACNVSMLWSVWTDTNFRNPQTSGPDGGTPVPQCAAGMPNSDLRNIVVAIFQQGGGSVFGSSVFRKTASYHRSNYYVAMPNTVGTDPSNEAVKVCNEVTSPLHRWYNNLESNICGTGTPAANVSLGFENAGGIAYVRDPAFTPISRALWDGYDLGDSFTVPSVPAVTNARAGALLAMQIAGARPLNAQAVTKLGNLYAEWQKHAPLTRGRTNCDDSLASWAVAGSMTEVGGRCRMGGATDAKLYQGQADTEIFAEAKVRKSANPSSEYASFEIQDSANQVLCRATVNTTTGDLRVYNGTASSTFKAAAQSDADYNVRLHYQRSTVGAGCTTGLLGTCAKCEAAVRWDDPGAAIGEWNLVAITSGTQTANAAALVVPEAPAGATIELDEVRASTVGFCSEVTCP